MWTADSSAFYYVRLDANHRPSRVYRHRLGTPAADDALVYEEADSRFFVSLGRTQSGRFADISVHDHETSECWLIDLDGAGRNAAAGRGAREHRCSTTSSITRTGPGEVLVVRTNADGAEDFKIVVTPLDRPEPARTGAISCRTGAAPTCSP